MKFWQVDAFAKEAFKGNPAAVLISQVPLDDSLMQNIAIEMALSETAFVLLRKDERPLLRWFTPIREVDLCGHATLAAAHIYLTQSFPKEKGVAFATKEAGDLSVRKEAEPGMYSMDFPARPGGAISVSEIPEFILDALSPSRPVAAFQARDLMLVYENEDILRRVEPDYPALAKTGGWIIVTAPSEKPEYDFVSRFFCPDEGMEDPVTGSAHCTLGPYWSQRLGKERLSAWQASKRGGHLVLNMSGDRVIISGPAVTVVEGNILFDKEV